MLGDFTNFFVASTGASAAFIGLLFVALSFIDSEEAEEGARQRRRIIASNAFSQLVNVFFVSLTSLYADLRTIALVSIVMAVLGLLASIRLLPAVFRLERRNRALPYGFGAISTIGLFLELGFGISTLHAPGNTASLNLLALSVIIFFAGALARAWEITGIRR